MKTTILVSVLMLASLFIELLDPSSNFVRISPVQKIIKAHQVQKTASKSALPGACEEATDPSSLDDVKTHDAVSTPFIVFNFEYEFRHNFQSFRRILKSQYVPPIEEPPLIG